MIRTAMKYGFVCIPLKHITTLPLLKFIIYLVVRRLKNINPSPATLTENEHPKRKKACQMKVIQTWIT